MMIDLLQSSTRMIIYVVCGLYALWHFAATINWPAQYGERVWATSVLFLGLVWLVLKLLSRRRLAAQVIWLTGCAALITLDAILFARPEVALLYALLPFMAMVMIGWRASLLAGTGVGILLLLIVSILHLPLTLTHILIIAIGALISVTAGWAASSSLSTAVSWSYFHYLQSRQNLQIANEQSGRLVAMVKNLDQVNYQLVRTNTSLITARREAEEARRFKTEFVNNVSHELRTPLNLIVGFSEVMMTSPESYGGDRLPGPYRRDLNAIYHSARHLLALINDVLDLARIERGMPLLNREKVALSPLISEVVETMRDHLQAKGLELRVKVPSDLPMLWLDQLRIRQVFLNLLANAARFTDEGWIQIEAELAGDHIIVRVKDSGCGITSQDLPKVFEPFRSAERPLSAWQGSTGLGLPISKQYVELHGGRMGVESVIGKGSTFWFTLPVKFTRPYPAQFYGTVSEVHNAMDLEPVLIMVHDDPMIIAMVRRYLEGYQLVPAESLEKGLELVDQVKAAGMIIDDHLEIPQVPNRILLIRCGLPSRRQTAETLGVDDLLVKPVTFEDLQAAVARVGRPLTRLLIVDNDPDLLRLFQRMLQSMEQPPECLTALNSAEALETLHSHHLDGILFDLALKPVDGIPFLDHLAGLGGDDGGTIKPALIAIAAEDFEEGNFNLKSPAQLLRSEGFSFSELIQVVKSSLDALTPQSGMADSNGPASVKAPVD